MKPQPSSFEQDLLEDVLSYRYDPLGFVMYAFPWGQANTPLQRFDGPRTWQREDLEMIGDHLTTDYALSGIGVPPRVQYLARSSGRGPGKSALVSMLNYWLASCWPGGTGIVTANTEVQLRTRTMAEMGKWHTLAINRHWFEKSSMSLRPAPWYRQLIEEQMHIDCQYFYVDGQTWSEDNPDAFAGAHSQIAMMLTFDEASGISDPVWNVSEGFFTDQAPLRLWLAISNPRRVNGRFYDCFHRDRGFWNTKSIDSRTVEGIDRAVYDRIVDKYGEDHDVTRVEVKGEFPKSGDDAVISLGLIEESVERDVEPTDARIVWGVDVARKGMDRTVIAKRCGNTLLETPIWWRGKRITETAGKIVDLYNGTTPSERPHTVVVDSIGMGAGLVDILREQGIPVKGINVSEAPGIGDRFARLRDDLYFRMRDWFETQSVRMPKGCDDLIGELTTPWYTFTPAGKIKVASKDEIKKELARSPDLSDAFMLTFAVNDKKSSLYLPPRTDLERFI